MTRRKRNYYEEARQCKVYSHQMEWIPWDYRNSTDIPGDAEMWRCPRCFTRRIIVLSPTTGMVVYSRYIYEKEYGELPTRLDARLDWVKTRSQRF